MELSTKIECKFQITCRICLVQSENINKIDFKMFEYCTGINITQTSDSTDICEKCNNSLKEFSSFKTKCLESHESLNKMKIDNKDQQTYEDWLDNCDSGNQMNEVWLPDDCEDQSVESNEDMPETKPEIKEEPIDCFQVDDNVTKDKDNLPKAEKSFNKKTKKKETSIIDLCMYCGKHYSRKTLQTHINVMHTKPVSTERHKCDQCDKTYMKKDALTKHRRIHLNVKPYPCSLCDEKFLYWMARRDHMVYAHSAPYRYNCDICDYKTQQSHALARHKRTHTGELPFQCTECQKQFITNRQLTIHIVTHTKEKNEICEVCNKAFGSKRYLNAHMKIHTQVRNYVCPVESCGKSFIQNHVLKSHMKSNHPEVEIPPSGTVVSIKKIPK